MTFVWRNNKRNWRISFEEAEDDGKKLRIMRMMGMWRKWRMMGMLRKRFPQSSQEAQFTVGCGDAAAAEKVVALAAIGTKRRGAPRW